MKIHTSNNQAECISILTIAGALEHLVPTPGRDACYGVSQIGESEWVVSSNDNGFYTVHFVVDASQAEVMDFMIGLAGPGGVTNSRVEMSGGDPAKN